MSIGLQTPRGDVPPDERVDVRRYLTAIARSRRLIGAIVLIVTVVVVVVSLLTPKTYTATTSIVLQEDTTSLADTSAESLARILNTTQKVLTAEPVLRAAAAKLPGETVDSLQDSISSEVDPEANIIDVSGSDGNARRAAAIANVVSRTFLADRAQRERAILARTRERLQAQLDRLEVTSGAEATALRDRISQLTVAENAAGSDLQIVARADPPDSPSSPRPFRNAIIAIFGSLFLGILVALGRDQLSPRVGGPRELGRLLDLRVLAGIPYVRQRGRRAALMSGVEAEAYETLRAAVEVGAPPGARVILVTGAVHAEGKTTVTWRLGNALARTGHRTLVVSADLRVPRMHLLAGVELGTGLAEILAAADAEEGNGGEAVLERSLREVIPASPARRQNGCLHLVTSGEPPQDPGRLLSSPGLRDFLGYVRQLDYDFVLIDAPPLIGIADSQVLARNVDQLMVVTRLDRITLDHVAELREVIDRLDVPVLGLVVIGARGEASPYYLARRPPLIRSEAETAS